MWTIYLHGKYYNTFSKDLHTIYGMKTIPAKMAQSAQAACTGNYWIVKLYGSTHKNSSPFPPVLSTLLAMDS